MLAAYLPDGCERLPAFVRDAQGVGAAVVSVGLTSNQPQRLQLIDQRNQAAGMHPQRRRQLTLALALRSIENPQDPNMVRRQLQWTQLLCKSSRGMGAKLGKKKGYGVMSRRNCFHNLIIAERNR